MQNVVGGLPAPLVHSLTTDYSTRLYGQPHLINTETLRVVWPSALDASGHAALSGHVSCVYGHHVAPNATFLFLDTELRFLNAAALWVHQPPHHLLAPSPSHSWVEVSHCFYYNWGEHIHPGTPMWFFATPGSGLWLNLGNNLLLSEAVHGPARVQRVHKVRRSACMRPQHYYTEATT